MLRETIERLLKGEFICKITCPDSVKDLEDENIRPQIEAVLDLMNRKLTSTANKSAYFAVWKNLENKNDKESIKREFQNFRDQLRPIVEFVLAVMDCNTRDHPLVPGDQITEAEITAKVQSNQFLVDEFKRVQQLIFKRGTNDPIPEMIHAILDKLEKFGILKETIQGSRIFSFTGKIDYVYEVLEYIDAHENIMNKVAEEKQAIQEELFS